MLEAFSYFAWSADPIRYGPIDIDIEAKADHVIEAPDRPKAVMSLFFERFRLKSHRESRELPAMIFKCAAPSPKYTGC